MECARCGATTLSHGTERCVVCQREEFARLCMSVCVVLVLLAVVLAATGWGLR